STGFPPNDTFNLNEVVPPQDGDGLYVALAPLGNTVPTTPEGVLLTTFQFLALADTPQTPVDILDSGGDPLGETMVFDGIVPNLDVSGTLSGSVVEIILEPPPDPTLLLTADPSAAQIGDPVVVTLSMLNLGSNEAAGFQAFLSFDITRLTFISGSYTPEPFGLPIILPIEADGGNIDLAAVINVFGGQSPTSVDAELVQLTFEALVGGCVVSVTFREYITPTALTDPVGLPIEPLLLIGLPDLAEVDDDDACTDDICDPDTGEVTHIPNYDNQSECCDPATGNTTLIDDSDACTDDTCDPLTGQVTHTPIDPSTCNDGIACTFDFCDSQLGCVSAPVNSVCDDGLACTTDICDAELGCVNSSECPTDVDGDFNTGAFDLAVLLGCWGVLTPGVCDCLDADDNGDIGAFDLAVLLGGWGPCDLSAPPNDDCVDHISIFNGDTLFDSISATTDGPAHPDDCQFDGQTPIDIWYDYNATCTGDLTLSTCDQSIYNSDLVVYDGCDCGNLVLLGCNDDAAECALFFTSELTVPVVADNCYLVRIGGFGAAGTITISCAGG
ncbi:MAG: cohesin domain-containing protein, partial [Planctomycetota bacterium]|nr:cohesin domain-containing protein [Planctomycetota bacterium]